MEVFQQRVVDEKAELDQKIAKLGSFFDTDTFKALPGAERERMERQHVHMFDYSNVLEERIAAFSVEGNA